jgi:hypothetical protein
MKPGDLVKGQAVQPRTGEFEWLEGEYADGLCSPGKSWIRCKGQDRLVWNSTLELIAVKDEEEVTPRGGVLREAEKLITGDRNKNYGTPTENFDTTAALWNTQLGHKLKPGESFTATDVALLMVQLKMARLKTSISNRDHYVDIAGYIACGLECQEVEDASA